MSCHKCSNKNESHAKFCLNCGTKLKIINKKRKLTIISIALVFFIFWCYITF